MSYISTPGPVYRRLNTILVYSMIVDCRCAQCAETQIYYYKYIMGLHLVHRYHINMTQLNKQTTFPGNNIRSRQA